MIGMSSITSAAKFAACVVRRPSFATPERPTLVPLRAGTSSGGGSSYTPIGALALPGR